MVPSYVSCSDKTRFASVHLSLLPTLQRSNMFNTTQFLLELAGIGLVTGREVGSVYILNPQRSSFMSSSAPYQGLTGTGSGEEALCGPAIPLMAKTRDLSCACHYPPAAVHYNARDLTTCLSMIEDPLKKPNNNLDVLPPLESLVILRRLLDIDLTVDNEARSCFAGRDKI